MKKIGVLLCVLLISLAVIGCSSDDTTRVDNIEGESDILVGETETYKVTEEGTIYGWDLRDNINFDGEQIVQLLTNDKQEVKVEGKNPGEAIIMATVDSSTYSRTVRVYGEYVENHYGRDGSLFHAVAYLPNVDKYIAAGAHNAVPSNNPEPYAVMGETNGATYWESNEEAFKVDGGAIGEGRFYGVQDIIADYGVLRSNHEYYLIGYSKITSDNYQGYLVRVGEEKHSDGAPKTEAYFVDNDTADGSVFLRSGVGVQADSGSRDYTEIIVVGNYQVDENVDTTMGVAPYVGRVNLREDAGDSFTRIELENDETLAAINQEHGLEYYYLSEITTIASDNRPDDGYLAVGFAGDSSGSASGGAGNGIVMKLNSDLGVKNVELFEGLNKNLYTIKRKSSSEFIVAGNSGYIALVNEDGEKTSDARIDGVGNFRGVEVDGGNYLLVSYDGELVKVSSNLEPVNTFGGNGIIEKADILMDITKSDNGYFLAGHKNNKAYVVKIDSYGSIMKNEL